MLNLRERVKLHPLKAIIIVARFSQQSLAIEKSLLGKQLVYDYGTIDILRHRNFENIAIIKRSQVTPIASKQGRCTMQKCPYMAIMLKTDYAI